MLGQEATIKLVLKLKENQYYKDTTMRPGTRSLKTVVLKNGRILQAEGKEFFATEDHWVFFYNEDAEVKMQIPTSNIEYMFDEAYRQKTL